MLSNRSKSADGEYITTIYRLDQPDCYYTVSGRFEEVWNLADGRRSLQEIASTISRKYSIQVDVCISKIRALLSKLQRSGLIDLR